MNDKVILNKEEFIKVGMFKITPGERIKISDYLCRKKYGIIELIN